MPRRFLPICLLTAVAAAVSAPALRAVEDILVIRTSLVTGAPTFNDGHTFNNDVTSVTSVGTSVADYNVVSLADNVVVRRNTVNANQSSAWYASSGSSMVGTYQTNYGTMLLSNNIHGGSDNTFANGSDTNQGNIERLDFTWSTARTASSSLAFGVFDRGAVGVHDSFAIAAITALDAFGNPAAYSSLLRVAAGWGGATNPLTDQSYNLFRYNAGDDISTSTASSETGAQGIGGILIKASDFGLADGTEIYGYSLMATDVNITDPSQLVDYTNTSVYGTNTDGNTGGGGIDLASLNGVEFQAVPEPASWALLGLTGLGMTFHLARRRQRLA